MTPEEEKKLIIDRLFLEAIKELRENETGPIYLKDVLKVHGALVVIKGGKYEQK